MLRVCPAGQVCASSWFGQACSAQRDAAGEIPISTLFLCCNLRGEKTPQIPTTLSAPADEALFSPPAPSPRLFQHLFEHFTTLLTRNAVGLLELGGLFSKFGRSCARKNHPGVLSKTGEGASAGSPCRRAAVGAVEMRCQPRLAACGEFPCIARRLCLASWSDLSGSSSCDGCFCERGPVLDTCCLSEGKGDVPTLFNVPL